MTLLEKAERVKTHRRIRHTSTAEEIDLALAFFTNRINSKQVSIALGFRQHKGTSVSAIYRVAVILQNAIREQRLRLVEVAR